MMFDSCPKCKRNLYRIVKGLCQPCYATNHNKDKKPKKEKLELTNLQEEFIVGSLLGDAFISNMKYRRKSPNFGIDRKHSDLDYLKWQYSFLENLCKRPIKVKSRYNKVTDKTYDHCSFETRYLPCLIELRDTWYPNGTKIVPRTLKLSKLIIQIWYCDDGTLELTDSGKFRIKFATNGFSKDDVDFLASLLEERYNEKFSIHKDGSNFRITAGVKAASVLWDDIKDNFPPGIERKIVL